MAAGGDGGTDKATLKRMLAASKSEPVNCAVALTKESAVMLLHKTKPGRGLIKDLEKDNPDAKNARYGTAFVNTDEDATLVILTLNKPASGLARKLKKAIKGTGFSKVEIRNEDGSVAESVGDEEEGQDADGEQAAGGEPAADAAGDAAPEAAVPDANAAPAPAADGDAGEQSQDQQPANDMGALTKQLTELVKRMMPIIASDPSRQDQLKGLATQAQGAIRSNDASAAQTAIDQLETALDGGGAGAPGGQDAAAAPGNGAAKPNLVQFGKARLAWVAARKKVEDEVGKLHKQMAAHYQGHGFGAELDKYFSAKIEPMLSSLDTKLADKLDEVTNNKDPAQHAKLVAEAQQIIAGYESYLSGEKLISQLDSNPFVPLSIEKTLMATLAALNKAVA